MKRKITQIGRLFAAAALFFGASSWASAQTPVTATWALTEGGGDQQVSVSVENILSGSMALESKFSFAGTEDFAYYATEEAKAAKEITPTGVVFTKISPSEKFQNPTKAWTFTLTPEEGVAFTPTKLTVNAARFGTGSGKTSIYVKTASGASVELQKESLPGRARDVVGEMYSTWSYDISGITPAEGEIVSIEFHVALDGGKSMGLNDLVIEGTYTAPEPAEAHKVAYLCGANSTDCNDAIFNALKADGMEVTALNFDEVSLTGDLTADGLADYDLVVIAGPTGSGVALAKTFDKIVGKVPVLSTKAFWYNKTSPAWGAAGVNQGSAETPSMTVNPGELYVGHDIFKGIENDGTIAVFAKEGREGGRYLQGIPTETVVDHITVATSNGVNCIAEAWVDGIGYVIVPVDGEGAEYTVTEGALTEAGAKLFVNAANYLIAGKQYEVPYLGTCPTPAITATHHEETVKYVLSITAEAGDIEGLKFYYTTDGSEPTAEKGKLYDAAVPDTLVDDCTVKAIACADKYRNSEVAEYVFVNASMTQLATPVIATTQNEKDVTVTITSTNDDIDAAAYAIYYTIDGSEPTAKSKLYTEPFGFAGGSATVKAIAIGEGYKNSAIATQEITNTAYVAREKTLYQSDFNLLPTSWGYYDPESCDSQYSGKGTVSDPNTPSGSAITFISKGGSGEGKWHDWAFKSSKCRVFLPVQNVAGVGSDYGPATEADADATDRTLAFTNESGSVSTMTFTYTKQLEAPFDIIMYLGTGNKSGTLKCAVQVSDDMETWETVENISQPVDKMIHKQMVSYNGTGNKYIRLDFAGSSKNANGMIFDFIVKGIGVDVLTLQSVNPVAGTQEEPKEIDKTQSAFTATFNLDVTIDDAVAYFGAPAEGNNTYTKNCEIAVEGKTVTITRPAADAALAPGNYVLYLAGVKDAQGTAMETPVTAYYYVKAQLPAPTLGEPEQEDKYVSVVVNPLAEEYTGYNFYYTTDGSEPTTSSFLYDGTSIKFYGESATIKVIAAGSKYISSGVASVDVVNENYMPREKVIYSTDFHTPLSEWFYNVNFTYENDKPVGASVKDGAVWPEGITYTDWGDDPFRVHIFPKSNEYKGYRQYNNWSFYGESNRRIILQATKGMWCLGASGKVSAAPGQTFAGPFDIEVKISNTKQDTPIRIYVGDDLEGDTWELIGEGTIANGESGSVVGSYNGTAEKYVRFESTATEFYVDKFAVKADGYGELKLQSVSPAGGSFAAPATLEATATTFVLTFNNPLATTQGEDLVVYFGAAVPDIKTNCTYTVEGNQLTVTRSETENALSSGKYQFYVKGVKDAADQVMDGQVNVFYQVEGSSSVLSPEVEKTVVSSVIYSISGAAQSELTPGLNFVRTTYSDGTVEVEKVIKK